MQPNPTKSAQIQSKPLKAIQIFPDPSKYVAISTRIQRITANPTKTNYTCPLNPPQSFRVIPSQHKSKQIDWNPPRSIQTARNLKSQKVQLDSPNQVHQIFLNLSESTPTCHSCNHVNPTKSMQINSNCHKSSRDHRHLPKQNETQPNHQIATKSIQTRVDQRTQNASIIESQDCLPSPSTQTITDHAK